MKNRRKSLLTTVFLLILILFFVYFNYYYFVRATKVSHQQKLQSVKETIQRSNPQVKTLLLNEFSAKETYYIVKIEDSLSALDTKLETVAYMTYPGIDNKLIEKYGLDSINFGFYNNNFIYVVKNTEFEKWFNITDLKLLFSIDFKGE